MMANLFERTRNSDRHYFLAIFLGIISGIISGLVKSGSEGVLPPRVPGRVDPPLQLVHDFGIDTSKMIYTYSDQVLNWAGNGVHYIFSIVFAILYCFLAEIFPKIKLWQGVAFGLLVALGSHGAALPLLNLSPAPWDLPMDEIISEVIGSALWMWTIEIVRRDLRNRITGQPDPAAFFK